MKVTIYSTFPSLFIFYIIWLEVVWKAFLITLRIGPSMVSKQPTSFIELKQGEKYFERSALILSKA